MLDAVELLRVRTAAQAYVYAHTALECALDRVGVVDDPSGVFEVGAEPLTGTLGVPHQQSHAVSVG